MITTKSILTKSPSVFLNRNFLLLFGGKIISQLGDQIYYFALSWYILGLTKSSFQMAIFLVINTVVIAAVSPFGGIIADRLNRKMIMVWMDVIRGLFVLVIALLFQHLLQIWMLYLSALILGFCGAIFTPAASAIIPNIVLENQLAKASSANQFITSFCTMVGMLISGIIYTWIGIFAIFIFDALSFFISGIMEAWVKIPFQKASSANQKIARYSGLHKALQKFREGYQYVKNNKVIYYLLLMNTLFNFIALPIGMVYTPYFFNVLLKATPFQLAMPQASIWTGMIIGSFLAPIFLQRSKLKKLLFWGLLFLSLFTLLGIPWFIPQIRYYLKITNWEISIFWTVTNAICGMLVSLFTIPIYIIFQLHTFDEYRGRFWGLENSLRTFALCSGFFIAGVLAQIVWLGFIFLGTGIILFMIDLWAIHLTVIKELND